MRWPKRTFEERFWEKVNKDGPIINPALGNCWVWTAAKTRGYGAIAGIKSDGVLQAHRVSYAFTHGKIPLGLIICHKCDNPPCVNPKHLYAGTDADNMRDSMARGRQRAVHGEQHPHAKLTDSQIIEIRNLTASGMTNRATAKLFNVGFSAIARIRERKNWKHVL